MTSITQLSRPAGGLRKPALGKSLANNNSHHKYRWVIESNSLDMLKALVEKLFITLGRCL